MARVELSANIASIRGSVAGTTFQNSAYGQIMRNKPIPKKSANNAQQNIKLLQSQLNYKWADISASDRLAWDGKIGTKFRTGKQAFLNANFYLLFKGLTTLDIPAYNVTPPPIAITQLILNTGELFVLTDIDADMDIYTLLIKMSYPTGSTVVRARRTMRLLNYDTEDTNSFIVTPTYEETLSVTPVVGQLIWVSMALQNFTSGDVGAWTTLLMPVTPP